MPRTFRTGPLAALATFLFRKGGLRYKAPLPLAPAERSDPP